jgi:hypothetical protein
LDPVFDPLLLPIGIIRSSVEEPVFELILDPVLDSVVEIDEPIVESVFDLLDPMPDSRVDPNLEPLEDSTPKPLNDESSADPSLELVLEPVLELVEDDVRAQSIFESDSSSIVELVCESPVLDFDSSTCDEVFTCCSSGSGFGACSGFCLRFLDPQQPMS